MEAEPRLRARGEEPYCGASGRVGYMGWLLLLDRQSKPECMDYGSNPNEIYFLMDDEEKKIYGFGQLRPYDTVDVLTWAGHIGYSVAPSERGQGFAQELLRRLLDMGFARRPAGDPADLRRGQRRLPPRHREGGRPVRGLLPGRKVRQAAVLV